MRRLSIFTLVLACAVMTAPPCAGAAAAKKEKREVWTVTEAEIARQAAEGVPLKKIINGSVQSGVRIHEVVSAAVKVGVDPSQVVQISISEGYASQTVIRAALKAGAPLNVVMKSAVNAGVDKKSLNIGELVTTTIKSGADPAPAVSAAITEGFPAQTVVKAALKAGVPLPVVVKSAISAGADPKSIYVGAADAGEPPHEVERAIQEATTPAETVARPAEKKPDEKKPEKQVVSPPTPPPAAPSLRASPERPPAIFGRGGVVLTQLPIRQPETLLFHTEPLIINPFIAISETFGDNVAFTTQDRESDTITTVTPGVRARLPFQAHYADLEYYSVIARYGRHREEDVNDHHIGAAVDFKVADRFGLRLSDIFDRGHEPLSSTPTGSNEVFRSNAAAMSAEYQPAGPVKIQFDYSLSTWRFDTSDFRDRDENRITGAVFYRVLPGTSVFIEYDYRRLDYYRETLYSLDNRVGTVQAGLTWDLSARSKGTLKAGLARKTFVFSAMGDDTVKVGSADVRHNFTKNTSIVLTAQRSLNEPNLPGINYFISFGGYAELTHRFLTDWVAVFRGASVEDRCFIRTDRTALSGGGIKYRPKDWLEFAVDYNRRSRYSSIPANNYAEHSSIIMVNISL